MNAPSDEAVKQPKCSTLRDVLGLGLITGASDDVPSGIGMFQWLLRGRAAKRLAQADAEVLVRDHGVDAYGEARARELDVVLADGTTHAGRTPAHWRSVALIVARRTGTRVSLNALSRMLES